METKKFKITSETFSAGMNGFIYDESGDNVLKTTYTEKGYVKFKGQLVHRIIASLFIMDITENEIIYHIDRNKFNNAVENLGICSKGDYEIYQGLYNQIVKKHAKNWRNKKCNVRDLIDELTIKLDTLDTWLLNFSTKYKGDK